MVSPWAPYGWKTQLESDLLNIKGSPIHFSKTLMNLTINAAEAMPAEGTIFVYTCNTYLDTPFNGYELIPQGEYVQLSVVDEGVGISQEDQKHIFEPFLQKKHGAQRPPNSPPHLKGDRDGDESSTPLPLGREDDGQRLGVDTADFLDIPFRRNPGFIEMLR